MKTVQSSICHRHIESLFLYHAAPILHNVKSAVLITVRLECLALWKSREKAMCRATGLCITELIQKNHSALFLIYDKNELENILRNKEAVDILLRHGYRLEDEIEGCLGHLRLRFKEVSFPHEIGLFLGYPSGDVKAFIENEGKNCVCCRYWKAYINVEKSQRIWRQIDEAQKHAIEILHNLPPIHIAAKMLRTV